MSSTVLAAALAAAASSALPDVVTITGTLPMQSPATMESVSREQIDRTVNASDSEDALKYLPSLLVRKRYPGDYNHAILSSRASGTGNSARSAVYADGILLSNFLGNGVGGLAFPPRWNMVTPQEIERVDVLYGPFSAAYPGNSVGAVVAFTTRMPQAFEAHAKVGLVRQAFDVYATDATYGAWETSVSVGDRSGGFAWFADVSRSYSHGQPLTFATRLPSNGSPGGGGTPVTGAVADTNPTGGPWAVIGSATEYRSQQDHAKARLAWDLTPTLRAGYTLGLWRNTTEGRSLSYLRDGAGNAVASGPVTIAGRTYSGPQALGGADFPATDEDLTHVLHGLTLKSRTQGLWDWEATASLYDYRRDAKRQNAAANPSPDGGPGTIADGSGSGWANLALKGTWRPGAHAADAGLQLDRYQLRYRTSAIAGNWRDDAPGAPVSRVGGRTELASLWAQDAWAFVAGWKTVLGLRVEHWRADDGETRFSAASAVSWPSRSENHLSPKAALSWQATPDLALKASAGRAVRMPTVNELYGAVSTANSQFVNDPLLRPERSWTGELSAEQHVGDGLLRLTAFGESTRDALYSQTLFDAAANRNVSRVQNVGRIGTSGAEVAYSGSDVGVRGLDISASATYADSAIKANDGFVATPGDTIGRRQPNIPRWRATLLLDHRFDDSWSAAFGLRYSGRQYRTLNNADINGATYQGVSRFLVADVRLRWRVTRQWSAAVGVDNVNNDSYWNFHPYPQRSASAELRFDL